MTSKNSFIRTGDFFFKYRNLVFPLMWSVLFLAFAPAPGVFSARVVLACATVALGLAVRGVVIGFAYIKRGGLNKQVYADTLVTEGFFVACRNPLYVGNMLIYTGVFLMHGHPAVILIGTLGSFAVYQSIIAAEEYFLRSKFGESYEAYCREVPRWGIRLSRLGKAAAGMRFNIRRVLLKDYSTMSYAVVTLTFVSALRHYHYDAADIRGSNLLWHAAMIGGVLVLAAAISRAKKFKLLTLP